MRLLSSMMNFVRRKRRSGEMTKLSKKKSTSSFSSRGQSATLSEEMFKCPVLWKTADGKWHRHQLQISRAPDRSHWFSLTRAGAEVALHSSFQLMHSAFDSPKQSVHLIFVSGVLSLRFPTSLHTEQYFAWAIGAGIRASGTIFCAKIVRGHDRRKILLVTKDSSLVIVAKNAPLLFTTAQLIRAVTVRSQAVAILSAVPGNDLFLECDCGKELRNWYEMNTVQKQRKKMLTHKVSKPRSRVGKPKMGVLAMRRKKLSEASFEVFRRHLSR